MRTSVCFYSNVYTLQESELFSIKEIRIYLKEQKKEEEEEKEEERRRRRSN